MKGAAVKAGMLCLLGILTVSCLASGRQPEHAADGTVTHSSSARVSMLRRGRQEAPSSDSPLQQANLPIQEFLTPSTEHAADGPVMHCTVAHVSMLQRCRQNVPGSSSPLQQASLPLQELANPAAHEAVPSNNSPGPKTCAGLNAWAQPQCSNCQRAHEHRGACRHGRSTAGGRASAGSTLRCPTGRTSSICRRTQQSWSTPRSCLGSWDLMWRSSKA